MKYYLLSDQDIKEIVWEVENFIAELEEKIEEKMLEPDNEDK